MSNINYRIEEISGELVLVSQITGAKPCKVVGVHPEKEQLELQPSFPWSEKFEFSRIDSIDTGLLKKYFPESYI